jgi:hypothetical protein
MRKIICAGIVLSTVLGLSGCSHKRESPAAVADKTGKSVANYAETMTLSAAEQALYDSSLFAYKPRFPAQPGKPPDAPIDPHVFVANAGTGAWMLGRPAGSRKKSRLLFRPEIAKILAENGCPGGRIHIGVTDVMDPKTGEVKKEAMESIMAFTDACLNEGMYVLLMYQCYAERNPDAEGMQTLFRLWDEMSYKMRNKSHRLAMCPFIEWHGWEKQPPEEWRPKFKCMQKRCTKIFRRYNPTRIVAYKGMASSRVNGNAWQFLNLDKKNVNPYFVLSGSAASFGTAHHSTKWIDWDINKQYTNQQIKDETFNFFLPALKIQKKYNVAIYIDHWTALAYGDEKATLDMDERIAQIKKMHRIRGRQQRELRKLLKAKAEGRTVVVRKYKLSQSEAFINYVTKIMQNNGLGGAFYPHTFDCFWDRKTDQPADWPVDSPEYKAQQIIKNSWGKSKLWKQGNAIWK